MGAPATSSAKQVHQQLGTPQADPDFWHWLRNPHGLVTHAVEPAGGGGDRAATAESPFPKLTTSYQYSGDGFYDLLSIEYADETTESWTYDPDFHLPMSHTDQLGRTTQWRRDPRGNVAKLRGGRGGRTGTQLFIGCSKFGHRG